MCSGRSARSGSSLEDAGDVGRVGRDRDDAHGIIASRTARNVDGIKLQTPQRLTLSANVEIMLQCGASHIKLTPSGIEIAGPNIKINATSGITDIDAASQVKIKC